jgi:hypothetical protein
LVRFCEFKMVIFHSVKSVSAIIEA